MKNKQAFTLKQAITDMKRKSKVQIWVIIAIVTIVIILGTLF